MTDIEQLEEIIGTHNLEGQLSLMKTLIPKGRTRCISIVLAGFVVFWIDKSQVFDNELSSKFQQLSNNPFDDEQKDFLIEFINYLAVCANIPLNRMNRTSMSGEFYSVAETAYKKWVRWNEYKDKD